MSSLKDGLPAVDFEEAGLHLRGSVLWFDACRPRDLSFVSHAHFGKVATHQRILATDRTVRLYRTQKDKVQALVCPYHSPFNLGMLRLELKPAGHILGSAQLLVETEGKRVVYTGEICLHPSKTCEAAEIVPCDVLVLDATFGLQRYRFPPRLEMLGEIERFATSTLEDGLTPVLLTHPMGQAQELVRHLCDAGHEVRVHNSVYEVNRVYRELGMDPGAAKRFRGSPAAGEVVVFPSHLRNSKAIARMTRRRVAALSAWTLDESYRRSVRADTHFPLSNSADYKDLMRYVRKARPRRIYTVNGHAEDFAGLLRSKGYDAIPLVSPAQVDLFA